MIGGFNNGNFDLKLPIAKIKLHKISAFRKKAVFEYFFDPNLYWCINCIVQRTAENLLLVETNCYSVLLYQQGLCPSKWHFPCDCGIVPRGYSGAKPVLLKFTMTLSKPFKESNKRLEHCFYPFPLLYYLCNNIIHLFTNESLYSLERNRTI